MSYRFGLDQNVKDYLDTVAAASLAVVPASFIAAVAAHTTLTDGNATNVTALDTVTVDAKVYTFQTTAVAEGDIKVGTTADLSLTNLVNAINKSGGTPGTDYVVAAAHPTVSASAVAAHATTLTARAAGTAGNSIALTTTSAHLTPGAAALASGSNATPATPGSVGQFSINGSTLYVCTVANTTWKTVATLS